MHRTPGVRQSESVGRKKMKPVGIFALMFLFTGALGGCVHSTTTTRTWHADQAYAWGRPGYVDWVREVVHREQGDPVAGAVAGAIIGGILFGGGRGGAAVAGAVGGAALGAAASSGRSEVVLYEVAVRFEDGGFQVFSYQGHSPFRPGEPVLQTPNGLSHR
jgi:outer membrane lipoprotein SlyB